MNPEGRSPAEDPAAHGDFLALPDLASGPYSAYDLVRLDVFPDGGVARLRLHGSLAPEGLAEARRRQAETAPDWLRLP